MVKRKVRVYGREKRAVCVENFAAIGIPREDDARRSFVVLHFSTKKASNVRLNVISRALKNFAVPDIIVSLY